MVEEWTKYRSDLKERLIDEMMQICDVAVRYLSIEEELSRDIEDLKQKIWHRLLDKMPFRRIKHGQRNNS